MAYVTKSQVIGFIEETSEGVLKPLAVGTDFVPMREGASIQGAVESIASDELVSGSIGASKSYVTKEVPTGSFPMYLKHSGVEGQAPQNSIIIESCMGEKDAYATEYSVTAGSTTTALEMATDQEDNFDKGQAVLIKDGVNGFSIRNVSNVDSTGNQLDLNFKLTTAPASGVALGKCVAFRPGTTHPTFSVHHWQSLVGAAYYQAMAGCRTGSLDIQFPANGFAEINAEFAGINFYFNPVTIASTNKYIDFVDDVGTKLATLSERVYKTPIDLADEIQTNMRAASADVITCVYSNSTGKFTLSSDGTTFSLLFKTGTHGSDNTDDHAGPVLGFSDSTDKTLAVTYASDNALSFDTALVPSYDSSDNLVVKNNELFIGSQGDNVCVKASSASIQISTPKTDVSSICAESGTVESVILSREVTFSATVLLEKFQSKFFYNLVNNVSSSVMFNAGTKVAGNWVAGKCVNVYLPNCSITSAPVADQDGYQVFTIEAKAFVSSSIDDCYINFL
jgi:hypothetical protein